jgi:uncharacterized paraquat-inducible protein A
MKTEYYVTSSLLMFHICLYPILFVVVVVVVVAETEAHRDAHGHRCAAEEWVFEIRLFSKHRESSQALGYTRGLAVGSTW